jgi:hypothetical protein
MQGSFNTLSIFATRSALIGIGLIFWAVPLAGPRHPQPENAKMLPTIYRAAGVLFVVLSILIFGVLTGYLK